MNQPMAIDEDNYYSSKTYKKERQKLIEDKEVCAYCGQSLRNIINPYISEPYAYCDRFHYERNELIREKTAWTTKRFKVVNK